MTKHSRQRDAVYTELCSRKDHPTADELYLSLKNDFPKLGLATVYRNLTLLEKEGKVLRIRGESCDRFDGDVSEHCHFICDKCGKVTDISLETVPEVVIKDFKGIVKGKMIICSGLCEECVNNSLNADNI